MSDTRHEQTEVRPRIRRSSERGLQDLGWSTNRMTFSFADYYDPQWMRFGPLRVLIESRIEPNSGFSEHPHHHAEIVSYVTEGVLQHADSNGPEARIRPGEMQLISAGRQGIVHKETNPQTEVESHYQMWFVPNRPDTDVAYQELKPPTEERQGQFRLYISPDGRGDTMRVNTDAFVFGGLFSSTDGVSYTVATGRGAWIQVVEGSVSVGDVLLRTGDGAGFSSSTELELSFSTETELLLIDVRMDAPRVWD